MCVVDIPGNFVGFFVCSFVFEQWSRSGEEGMCVGEKGTGRNGGKTICDRDAMYERRIKKT